MVASPEAVSVGVNEQTWLPETVWEGMAYTLGVTVEVSLAVGESVRTVENDCEGERVSVALSDRLGDIAWVGVSVEVTASVCDPVAALEVVCVVDTAPKPLGVADCDDVKAWLADCVVLAVVVGDALGS